MDAVASGRLVMLCVVPGASDRGWMDRRRFWDQFFAQKIKPPLVLKPVWVFWYQRGGPFNIRGKRLHTLHACIRTFIKQNTHIAVIGKQYLKQAWLTAYTSLAFFCDRSFALAMSVSAGSARVGRPPGHIDSAVRPGGAGPVATKRGCFVKAFGG